MKISPDSIEKIFFEFVKEKRRSPSRKEIVEALGISGSKILEILGDYSKNLETTWKLNLKERDMLANLITEAPESLHRILSEVSFLPVWSAECRVISRKGIPEE